MQELIFWGVDERLKVLLSFPPFSLFVFIDAFESAHA